MFNRKKTASDEELERVVLQVAFIGLASEQESSKAFSESQIKSSLKNSFSGIGVKPTRDQQRLAQVSVGALMLQPDFFKRTLAEVGIPDFTLPLSTELRDQMKAAIELSVSQFLEGRGR